MIDKKKQTALESVPIISDRPEPLTEDEKFRKIVAMLKIQADVAFNYITADLSKEDEYDYFIYR